MRLLRVSFSYLNVSSRKRYDSEQYAEWVITETIDNFKLMYSVDTWYLPDFERILLGITDYVEQPSTWKSLTYWTLYLGNEIHLFTVYIYMLFLTIKSLAFSWQWHGWTGDQILSAYNWGVYVEDVEDNSFLDKNNSNFMRAHLFSFNNENSCLLMWELSITDFLYVANYITNGVISFPYKTFNFVNDFLFSKLLRFAFKASLHTNLFLYINIFFNKLLLFLQKSVIDVYNNKVVGDNYFKFSKNSITAANIFSTLFNYKKFKNLIKVISIPKNESFIVKPVVYCNIQDLNITASILRKQRVFTKSKYSRSRQYCKNIVFLGLLLNIILVFGLNSGYYAILINTGYFIAPVYIIMVLYSIFIFFKFKLFNTFN